MISSAEAVVIIIAFEHQKSLDKDQSAMLAKARKIVWDHANGIVAREAAPRSTCI